MPSFMKEQLDALRRQIEEEYRMDLAALDRLFPHFSGTPAIAQAPAPAPPSNSPQPQPSRIESAPQAPPAFVPAPVERKPDELVDSLRAMFTASYQAQQAAAAQVKGASLRKHARA